MSPILLPGGYSLVKRDVERPSNPDALVLEGWAQGYMVGSLVIMFCITMANMRRGVLLHKLILLELFLGIWHGFWIFFHNPVYAWWLSCSAIFLNMSWSLHNVIAWMKIKPFLSRTASWIFIGTVILVQPYWVVEIYANFTYFHNINTVFLRTRPWEALCRDPWWIFTTIALFYNIKARYDMKIKEIIRISPRFGIMLGAMMVSIAFIVLDVLSVTDALKSVLPVGINPFWKLSFVFKCLTDSVILDDFKTALDRLRAFKMSRLGSFSQDDSDRRARPNGRLERDWEEMAKQRKSSSVRSPDGDYVNHSHFPGLNGNSRPKHVEIVAMPPKPDETFSRKDSASSSKERSPTLPERMPVRRADSDSRPSTSGQSAIRRPENAWKRSNDHWVQLQDMEHSAEDNGEYARAVRDMSTSESKPSPTSPTSMNFSRPARAP